MKPETAVSADSSLPRAKGAPLASTVLGKVAAWRREWAIAATLGMLTFIVYWLGLAPTITWQHDGADSGDLATAVALGGVPHPTGYPTYLLIAELFKRLPLGGDVAYRLNVMSAICAAVAVGFLSLAAARTLIEPLPRSDTQPAKLVGKRGMASMGLAELSAAVAALTFAFSPPFWSQAVIAEVYTFNSLFVALLLWLALRVRAGFRGCLSWLCLTTGLAMGNHVSLVLVLPLILALIGPAYWQESPVRRLGLFSLALVGLSIYAIIPWRALAQAPVNWGGAYDWDGLRWLVTGKAYRAYVFGLPWEYAGDRILALIQIVVRALAWWGLPAAAWGWYLMVRHDRLLGVGSLLTLGLIAVYAVGYNTVDSYLYLLPALILMALWLARGLLDLLRQAHPFLPGSWAAGGLLLLPVFSVAFNFTVVSLRHDRTALDFAEETLRQAAPSAVIVVVDDRHTFALWYARYAMGQRLDVAIVNANLLGYDWYQASLSRAHPKLALAPEPSILVQQNLDRRSVYAIGDALNLSDQFVIEAGGDAHQLREITKAKGGPP